ncbi:helix-turn-helix transcriptional regulator [bacterium]|nr:helix-turn-helix transcriptional regulator [bacterium]
MQPREPEVGGLISPLELIKQFPGEPFAASDRRRWVGLEALRYRYQPPNGALQPPLTHLSLVLFINTPAEFELRCDGVTRLVPPRAGSVLVVPAGTPAWWRWSTRSDSLHVFLEPGLVARVAAEAFDLDPVRASIPPLDGLDLPPLRAAMLAVNDELTTDAVGDRLATESLANLLAVHLIRNASAPRLSDRRADDPLPREKLRAVIEFVEEHLDAGPSLDEMAAIAGVSPFHFARQFKRATGMPPHQYVITRRVERAKQMLQVRGNQSLAEVALHVGFSDQSQFTRHFKRLVGVTPGQFRVPRKNRLTVARPAEKPCE